MVLAMMGPCFPINKLGGWRRRPFLYFFPMLALVGMVLIYKTYEESLIFESQSKSAMHDSQQASYRGDNEDLARNKPAGETSTSMDSEKNIHPTTPVRNDTPDDTHHDPPNLLVLVMDQLRYDTLGYVQRQMDRYDGKLHIKTPNIDKLAASGTVFSTAYSGSPICAPARCMLRTGTSLQRCAVKNNFMVRPKNAALMPFLQERINALTSFEQVLVEESGKQLTNRYGQPVQYVAETYGKWHTPLRLYYERDAENVEDLVVKNLYREQLDDLKILQHNDFDFEREQPRFEPLQVFNRQYQRALKYLLSTNSSAQGPPQPGQQLNSYSNYWYTPIQLDPRHGMPSDTPLLATDKGGIFNKRYQCGESNIMGIDGVPGANFTSPAIMGQMALKALDRLIREMEGPSLADELESVLNGSNGDNAKQNLKRKAFSLAVHFNEPHPPMIAHPHYLDYYWQNRDKLFVPPSLLNSTMFDSAYEESNGRKYMNEPNSKTNFRTKREDGSMDFTSKISELTAVYYAMITDVDYWIGQILATLETQGLLNNTLIIFTSDHGEMLGSHSMAGKSNLLEEAARVPLIVSYPNGNIPRGQVIDDKTPVSHIDIFETILDYMGMPASARGKSDGLSLRRFIEGSSYNEMYDERYVVSELDKRYPDTEDTDNRYPAIITKGGTLGSDPNFMIRKDHYKLILSKSRDATTIDMLYDLRRDPYEMNNLIGQVNGMKASAAVVGKVEHLKALLLEWMRRVDLNIGSTDDSQTVRYYSDRRNNFNEGHGDFTEIRFRRTWREVDFWSSAAEDANAVDGNDGTVTGVLHFGPVALERRLSYWVRNEYLYFGRTTEGTSHIWNITIDGPDAQYFSVSRKSAATLEQNQYLRVKVTFRFPVEATDLADEFNLRSPLDRKSLAASILVDNDVTGQERIKVVFE